MTLEPRARFHLSWKKRKVRVRPVSIAGAPLNYAIREQEANAIDEFVRQNELGIRCSFDMWKMNSDAAKTMFNLRWS